MLGPCIIECLQCQCEIFKAASDLSEDVSADWKLCGACQIDKVEEALSIALQSREPLQLHIAICRAESIGVNWEVLQEAKDCQLEILRELEEHTEQLVAFDSREVRHQLEAQRRRKEIRDLKGERHAPATLGQVYRLLRLWRQKPNVAQHVMRYLEEQGHLLIQTDSCIHVISMTSGQLLKSLNMERFGNSHFVLNGIKQVDKCTLQGRFEVKQISGGFQVWVSKVCKGLASGPQVWQEFCDQDGSLQEFSVRDPVAGPYCIAERIDESLSLQLGAAVVSPTHSWLSVALRRDQSSLEVVTLNSKSGQIISRNDCVSEWGLDRCEISMHVSDEFLIVRISCCDGYPCISRAAVNCYRIIDDRMTILRDESWPPENEFDDNFESLACTSSHVVVVTERDILACRLQQDGLETPAAVTSDYLRGDFPFVYSSGDYLMSGEYDDGSCIATVDVWSLVECGHNVMRNRVLIGNLRAGHGFDIICCTSRRHDCQALESIASADPATFVWTCQDLSSSAALDAPDSGEASIAQGARGLAEVASRSTNHR